MEITPNTPDRSARSRANWNKLTVSLGALLALYLAYKGCTGAECIDQRRLISAPVGGHYNAVVVYQVCEGLIIGSSGSIQVKLKGPHFWNSETLVFEYWPGPDGEEPVVTWSKPDALKITVNSIEEIRYQTEFKHLVQIVYDIGHVGTPLAKPQGKGSESISHGAGQGSK
jgi:hypothetical protein